MSLGRKLCLVGVILCLCNFIAFVAGAAKLGGDAVNGLAQSGRYFVSSHGKLTEVTQQQYEYSRLHARSIWVTHPLGMILALCWWGLGKDQKSKSTSASKE